MKKKIDKNCSNFSPLWSNIFTFQTGFVETLKPQFTPGQVMLSPGQSAQQQITTNAPTNVGVTNVSMLQQQIEGLKEQLKDVTEKYETLKGVYFGY